MSKSYSFLEPDGGVNYEWESDHTFVKVSAPDTNGHYTLMEDNLKATFALGFIATTHMQKHFTSWKVV